MSKKAVLLAVLWGAITAAVALVPGCYGNNCTGEVTPFGSQPGEGHMIDENTWESSAIDGHWLDYPRARLWTFEIRELGNRKPQLILPYIAPVAEPNVAGKPPSNFTLCGGNLCEISGVDTNRVAVQNGTCADYFLRLVVVAAPRPPEAPVIDAGEEANDAAGSDGGDDSGADGGASDAGADATTDSGDAEAGP